MQTLLKLLQDGRFHSGEELGAVLGISRSAVWKRLQHLEAEHGLQFHKVRGRGYRLASPLSLLDPRKIDSLWPVEIMPTVDSTNSEAMRRLAAGASTPFVIVAEQQTAGPWTSRPSLGQSLWREPLLFSGHYCQGGALGSSKG
ncbi:bifunctional biotin--[acetyl-CoA-carboxylase] synthetase/biotin operon repressor [Pseudomonas aeruginosa]|nr:bifunctional biotin--[acetyl-CoA-carboxylase] synthetase/biotin operon repressor [Pseudomonas aeruginosa]